MAACRSTKIVHGIAVRAAFNERHHTPRCLRDYGVIAPEGVGASKNGRVSFKQDQVLVVIAAPAVLDLEHLWVGDVPDRSARRCPFSTKLVRPGQRLGGDWVR
jgi:hypothetical protein